MWHILGTKFKFSTTFQLLTDCQTEVVHESVLSSFTSHIYMESHHKLHKEVMDKIVQNNVHYKIWIDNWKLFKAFNIGDIVLCL